MNNQTSAILQKHRKGILEAWMQLQLNDLTLREDLITNQTLRVQSEVLLTAVIKIVGIEDFENAPDYQPIADTLSEMAISRARQGFSPRETGQFVLSMRTALSQVLEAELAQVPQLLYQEVARINKLVDSLTILTFETFIKGREEVILRQSDEFTEISTPVIRVWEGVLALPIIGTLDSARTQTVMENLLREIVTTGSTIAILDISGVPTVDSLVAQHLIKTVSATRLMGAECIISGIRAEIAQTIVHLGIDLSNIKTKATLASALQLAFSMMNVEVTKKSERK